MIFIFSRASISRLPLSLSLSLKPSARASPSPFSFSLPFFATRKRALFYCPFKNALSFASCVYFSNRPLDTKKEQSGELIAFFAVGVATLRVWSLLSDEKFFFFYFCAAFGGVRNRLVFFSLFCCPAVVTPFALLCASLFSLCSASKKVETKTRHNQRLVCSTREKKVEKREREIRREANIYIYIYESERRSGVFGAPRAHPRRRRRRRMRAIKMVC